MAGTFIPISFGWAAGDVSLAAYIQSSLARVESKTQGISALGAVMAFLYVTYISIYAILAPCLGLYVDKHLTDMKTVFTNIGGIHFTILAVIIFTATLIPRGALSLNPQLLDNERLDADLETLSYDEKEKEKGQKAPSETSSDAKDEQKL
jgi:MFS family permease